MKLCVSLFLSSLLLTGCGANIGSSPTPPVIATPGYITVGTGGGTQPYLLKDGSIWASHGVVVVALEAPYSRFPLPYLQQARDNYTSQQSTYFSTIKAWGADTIRLMVSQPGLDPSNSLYSPLFAPMVIAAVQQARQLGLVVEVVVQNELDGGGGTETFPFLPDGHTAQAWMQLTSSLNSDPGVIYEIFNEPVSADMTDWQTHMNALIAAIRQTGSKNTIIADGNMNNLYTVTVPNSNPAMVATPDLTDSTGNLAYAMHPYLHQPDQLLTSSFDTRFGNFALTHAVAITEWFPAQDSTTSGINCYNAPAVGAGGVMYPSTAQAARNLFAYLQAKNIGFDGFAFDFPSTKVPPTVSGRTVSISGTIATDFNGVNLTTFQNAPGSTTPTQCGDQYYGMGMTLKQWYATGVVPSTPL